MTCSCTERLNAFRPEYNDRNFADGIFECIFLNKNSIILVNISLNFVPNCSIDTISSLVQVVYWYRQNLSSMVQTMASRLVGANHYLNQCWNIVNWTLGNKLQLNLNQNLYISIQINEVENVVRNLAAISFRLQCVKDFGRINAKIKLQKSCTNAMKLMYCVGYMKCEFPYW